MAKITRYTGNVKAFAADSLVNERTVFGDVLTTSDTLNGNVTADFLRGWGIVGSSEFPTREDFNAMGYTLGQYIAYLHQMGVPEWSATQEYQIDSVVNRSGVLYFCQTVDHVSATAPEADAVNWRKTPDNSIAFATITPAADADVTVTAAQSRSHVLTLVDGSWLSGHSIIVPNESREFIVDNTAGTYNATVKTAAGTGVVVLAGQRQGVICDATNVLADRLAGELVQVVRLETGAHASGVNTRIPYDDTIPQNTEGTEFMTLAITPTSATSRIRAEVLFNGSLADAGAMLSVALFRDALAPALAAGSIDAGPTNLLNQVSLDYEAVAGSIAATTFKVRAGGNAASSDVYFNGTLAGRLFGGVCVSSITLTEYVA